MSDCRCEVIELGEGERPISRSSLECVCADGSCVMNLRDVPCGGGVARRGCGMLEVSSSVGFLNSHLVWHASSGDLIGFVREQLDRPAPPCQTFTHIAGLTFDCPEFDYCTLCGNTSDSLPSCF